MIIKKEQAELIVTLLDNYISQCEENDREVMHDATSISNDLKEELSKNPAVLWIDGFDF